MSITKLNYNQTNVVAGGYPTQEVGQTMGNLMEIFTNGLHFLENEMWVNVLA
jgi:hypothetical protein